MTGYTRGRTTLYKGIRMRSRLEASFAALLDSIGTKWTYEPQCFADSTGQYLPDFLVGGNEYVEVKPPTADTAAALRKMHVIRSSDPTATLRVAVPTGVYPNQRFTEAGVCSRENQCAHCRGETFHDARTIPVDPTVGRRTIGGRARRDVPTDATTGRATIGGRARRAL